MKSCPRCGKEYPEGERFCEDDGAALAEGGASIPGRLTSPITDDMAPEQSLECPVCGGKALPGEVRCNYCGARLRVDGVEDSSSAPSMRLRNSGAFPHTGSPSSPPEFANESSDGRTKSHRLLALLGFSTAAIIALAAGAWFAVYLSKTHPFPESRATPAVAASAPVVELAKEAPLRTQGDVPGTTPRDSNSLLKVFDHNKAGLANVYANLLGSNSTMKDGMLVRLHILPDGTVDNGAVRISTLGNPSFDAEVIEAMTSWKFDSIKGSGVSADYRVIFAPSSGAAAGVESDLSTKLASLSPTEPAEYAFSPSGAPSAAVAESSPAMPSAAGTGSPASASTSAVAVGTPAPASEPTMVAGLPPAVSSPPAEPRATEMPARPKVRHRPHRPIEMAALPPPKPPLFERVKGELHANRRLRRVQAYTNGSVVTIFGKVFDDDDRLLAERTVRNTDGVSAVINNLTTDTQQWEQNQSLITRALQNAGLDNVQVKVIGQDAYLSGHVKKELDRERAVTVAQSAAPVRVRENLITVAIGNMFGF